MAETLWVAEQAETRPAPSTEPFDAARALGHVAALSYPRRVGTIQERRAARYIRGEFAAAGLECRRERFQVPLLAREVGARGVLALCGAAVVAGVRLAAEAPLGAAALWLGAAALVNAPWAIAGRVGRGWARPLTSENLIATEPDRGQSEAPARVVFMAHYDTKSQLLPTGLRVGLVAAATGLCLVLAAAAAAGGRNWLSDAVVTRAPGLVLVILAVLAANRTGNRSPGALDNGSGLGVLLELARSWRPTPGEPIEALWIASGSEETGLDGARDFLRRHEAWWRAKPTLLVNLDSVGAGDRVYLAGEPGTLALAESVAGALGIRCARLRVLGAGMDHQPFAARGLCAVSVLGDVVGRSMAMHSRRDTPDRVEADAMERAAALADRLARVWAARYQPPCAREEKETEAIGR